MSNTGPNVAPVASYPNALKVFQVFHDYTDLIMSVSINECHAEILELEKTLGINPFTSTPYTTFGGAIQDLYANKAPMTHTHTHSTILSDAVGNDHPQYIQVSGWPGFTGPVGGKAGGAPNDLVPLSQLQSFGYVNAAQVEAMVNAALGNLMVGCTGGAPLAGSPTTGPNWRIQGGLASGCTDGNGIVTINIPEGYGRCVQAFVATKLPPLPVAGGGFPCTPYNWQEAQLTLYWISGFQAKVQFSHDYSWQPGMWVSFSWIVIGT